MNEMFSLSGKMVIMTYIFIDSRKMLQNLIHFLLQGNSLQEQAPLADDKLCWKCHPYGFQVPLQ